MRWTRVAGAALAFASGGLLLQQPSTDAYASGEFVTERAKGPSRTIVRDSAGQWLATFTNGARTVRLKGPDRVFAEPGNTAAQVESDTWVRMLAAPFTGHVDDSWLRAALKSTAADVLAVAMGYIADAPSEFDGTRRIGGDADYGPLLPDGSRQEGSDFNDFLGVAWTYGTSVDEPEPEQIGALDCSGYMRMVLGYRSGVPMVLTGSGGLPRRAVNQATYGVSIIRDRGRPTVPAGDLSPGDLVFFDVAADDGTAIDHVGMYLGTDSEGHARFVSSRKTVNGPTLGDVGGRSTINGTGYYARGFRSARRV